MPIPATDYWIPKVPCPHCCTFDSITADLIKREALCLTCGAAWSADTFHRLVTYVQIQGMRLLKHSVCPICLEPGSVAILPLRELGLCAACCYRWDGSVYRIELLPHLRDQLARHVLESREAS